MMSVKTWILGAVEYLALVLGLAGLGYLEFTYSKVYCWDELYVKLNRHAPAIGLMVEFNLLLLQVFVAWMTTVVRGPGQLRQMVIPYDLGPYIARGKSLNNGTDSDEEKVIKQDYDRIPQIFMCNAQGYPFWCPTCRSLKVQRSHHSKRFGHCVPRFDHKCLWLGTVIAEHNFESFFMTILYLFVFFLYTFISMSVFMPQIKTYTSLADMKIPNPNIIACYIGVIFWLVMIAALVGSHVQMLFTNEATIDRVAATRRRHEAKRGGHTEPEYVNIAHPSWEHVRVVVQLEMTDKPFNKGILGNIADTFRQSNWIQTVLGRYDEEMTDYVTAEENLFSDKFTEVIRERVLAGEGRILGETTE